MTAPPKKPPKGPHARARARQRFGFDLSVEDFRQIKRDVAMGNAIWISDSAYAEPGQRVCLFDVLLRGRLVRIVFDVERAFVITVYGPNGPAARFVAG